MIWQCVAELPPHFEVDFHAAAREESGFLARQPRAGMTEKGTHSLSVSFSRAWLPRVKNPDLFSVI